MNICRSFRCWWCWTYRWCWCEGYPISMNISQPFYPRNCYYATNLTGTNSAEECLQSCNTWQNEGPRHCNGFFLFGHVHENQNQKIGRSHLGSVLCESVDQIQWSVPLRIPTVMSSLFDPAAHSDGYPSQIGNHTTWWRRWPQWWRWCWWPCWWYCGRTWRLVVSNRQSAEDHHSGAERRGKRSLQTHKDKHKDEHKHRD